MAILQVAVEGAGRKAAACFLGLPEAVCGWLSLNYVNSQPSGAFGFHLFDIINALLLFYTIIQIKHSIRQSSDHQANNSEDFVKSLVDTRYDALDRLYFDLLKERRERAYTPGSAATGDPYPLMVWNFIESITDKCLKDLSGELSMTWSPVMANEARNFGTWLRESNGATFVNAPYFRRRFFAFGNALVSAAEADAQSGVEFDGVAFLRLNSALEQLADEEKISADALTDLLMTFYSRSEFRAQAGWTTPKEFKADPNPHDRQQRREYHKGKLSELTGSLDKVIAESSVGPA